MAHIDRSQQRFAKHNLETLSCIFARFPKAVSAMPGKCFRFARIIKHAVASKRGAAGIMLPGEA
jgi:hypothetical protein